jgi:hypothetical protein
MTDWDPNKRLLTAAEAAASIDRPVSTIRRWAAEGRITSHAWLNTTTGRQNLYLEADILKVEAATRRQTQTSHCEPST